MNAVTVRDTDVSTAIKKERAYRAFYKISALSAAGTKECYLSTPNDEVQRKLYITDFYASGDKVTLELLMGVTSSTGGTAVVPRNMNDNSTNTTSVTMSNGATVTPGTPTTVETLYIGGTSGAGTNVLTEAFRVLKNNTKYSIKITNGGSGAADIFVGLMLIE